MNEIWKLYVDNYSGYPVVTNVLTKLDLLTDPVTQKYKDIVLSTCRIYVLNLYVENY